MLTWQPEFKSDLPKNNNATFPTAYCHIPNIKAVGLVNSEKKIFFFTTKTYMLPWQPGIQFNLHKTNTAVILAVLPSFSKLALVPGHVICKSLMLHLNFKTKDILTVFPIQRHRQPMLTSS